MGILTQKSRGVSLVLEVVIGLGIFLCAFLLSYGVFPMSQRALAESRNQLVANGIARECMEIERDRRTERVVEGDGEKVVVDKRTGNHVVEGRDSQVEYQVTVRGSDGPVPSTRLVEVFVRWSYGGLSHETVLSSLISQEIPD
jgi:hypothetical protein